MDIACPSCSESFHLLPTKSVGINVGNVDGNAGWMMAQNQTGSKRHPEKALSAVFVRQVVEPGKYSDGNGLFLLVQPNGSKSWVQRITIRGKRRDIGLGGAGYVSLAEAREIALENKKLARAGGDPLQAKREAQAVLPFAEAARKVHEIHKPTWRNKKHAAQFIIPGVIEHLTFDGLT